MTALATTKSGPLPEAVERVLVGGDLSDLTTDERLAFYHARCEAAGLDPRTQPFQYIKFTRGTQSGKLALYATKSATDQLIANRSLHVTITGKGLDQSTGCYTADCRVSYPTGQTVDDMGAVPFGSWSEDGRFFPLSGENAANAMMKAITKAKRRTVLSACGLGMLDESEVDSIQGAVVSASSAIAPTPRLMPPPIPEPRQARTIARPSSSHSEAIPKAGSFREWLERECRMVQDRWNSTCLIDQVAPAKTPGASQVGNHLIKLWIETDALDEADILTEGKRDKRKIAEALNAAWDGEDQAEVKDEVLSYLRSEVEKLAEAAGVNMDSEPIDAEVVEAVEG